MGLGALFKGLGQKMLGRIYVSSYGEPPKRGTQQFLESFQASPYMQACAAKVGQSVGETEWQILSNGRVVTDNPMLQTLANPNPQMTGMDLFRLLQIQLDMVGEVFLVKERNGLVAPRGLYPVPAHWVAETPDVLQVGQVASLAQSALSFADRDLVFVDELAVDCLGVFSSSNPAADVEAVAVPEVANGHLLHETFRG